MRGVKWVAGLSKRVCNDNGYGVWLQVIYNPDTDTITAVYENTNHHSYVPVNTSKEVSLMVFRPVTMKKLKDDITRACLENNYI